MKTTALFCLGLLLIFGTMLAAQTPGPCLGVSGTAHVNWPQFHSNPCHTGYNASEFILSPATVGNLVLNWEFETGAAISSAAVVNGIVYVGSFDNNVYAFNASTGAKLWSFTSFISRRGDRLFRFLEWQRLCITLDRRKLWRANGVVYIGGGDGNFHALDGSTGAELWSYSAYSSTPAVANGMVYFASDSIVYALNASTGARLWSYNIGPRGGDQSSPAVANGVVYVGSNDGNVYALNATTGEKLWSYTTGGLVWSSPAVANGVVYVGSFDKNVYALNASTGAKLWSYTTGGYVRSSPAVANGVVYIGSDNGTDYGHVYALDALTGVELWRSLGNVGVWSSPAVVNGMVYVSSLNYILYAFHLPGQ